VEGEGGWLLNPNSSFPITVSCGHRATAQKIKRILEKSREMPFDEAVAVLADTMYRKGARIRELDAELLRGRGDIQDAIHPRDPHIYFAMARLVIPLWFNAFRDPVRRMQERLARVGTEIQTRWKVVGPADKITCAECAAIISKSFAANEIPRVPVHFGCRCQLLLDHGTKQDE
jgi:hypothetical protein